MFITLAIVGSIVGLIITGIAVATAWAFLAARNSGIEARGQNGGIVIPAGSPWNWFLRWTAADYMLLLFVCVGFVFLLADLIAVLQDRAQFPPYHYAYLLCGVLFSAMGMLVLFARLLATIKLAAHLRTLSNDAHKPKHTEHAE